MEGLEMNHMLRILMMEIERLRICRIGFQPQTRHFTFKNASVTYGGSNGAYYTASKTRRTGSDGLTIDESNEADTATRQATHKLSRGLHNKMSCLVLRKHGSGMLRSICLVELVISELAAVDMIGRLVEVVAGLFLLHISRNILGKWFLILK